MVTDIDVLQPSADVSVIMIGVPAVIGVNDPVTGSIGPLLGSLLVHTAGGEGVALLKTDGERSAQKVFLPLIGDGMGSTVKSKHIWQPVAAAV